VEQRGKKKAELTPSPLY